MGTRDGSGKAHSYFWSILRRAVEVAVQRIPGVEAAHSAEAAEHVVTHVARECGGSTVYVAKDAARSNRNHEIVAMYSNAQVLEGTYAFTAARVAYVARQFKLSERLIYQIVRKD